MNETKNLNVVESILKIIQDNPGITYEEINLCAKTQKLRTNRALLCILINDLIVTHQIRRTSTSPKKYYLR